ncbi:chemotaxis protein CheB [Polluticoccus soli]|uniref:chemotaxis protein CheB n=1 Tax=Polluticoccus soli TaxID=3034150 RepID=UPI0023E0B223|nr:chemotaxis protein CheB [Flavipsychrobacter sp. JY13-12]
MKVNRVKKEITETQDNSVVNGESESLQKQDHFIVAIGASAGGLEAIHDFFDNARPGANVSYIIIQHLSPDYKSLLVELVSKHTRMQVFEAKDNVPVEKNCIYVIPPKKTMSIAAGRLQLTEKSSDDKGPNTAIDTFLYSLAEDCGENAVAVILSGTGTDGTKGIAAIKEAGGLVVVQEPETAKFDGMPRSAIASELADFVLAPGQMPLEINNHAQEVPPNIFAKGQVDLDLLEQVFKLVVKQTGCDFHNYKLPTILRRVSRRMAHHGYKNINEYINYLGQNPEECKTLCKDFLIGVTRFFRDAAAFDVLDEKVIPQIIAEKEDGDTVKVWIAACSTGEEAYSIAMLVNEHLLRSKKYLTPKFFATDIDGNAINIASKGEYPASIAKDVPRDLLDKYFIKHSRKYQIVPELRKQIVFAKHNIIKDPPFIKNDLASCRNMLIYMNPVLQKKIISTLNFSLNPDGYLFLGSSETVSMSNENLAEIDRKWKVYKKAGVRTQRVSDGAATTGHGGNHFSLQKAAFRKDGLSADGHTARSAQKGLTDDLKEIITDDLGYIALYIDKNYEVKEAVGDFKKYLSLPEQTLNLNLLRMVPQDLSTTLGMAIRKAWKENKKVSIRKALVKSDNKVRSVSIIIRPSQVESFPYTLVILGENEDDAVKIKPGIDVSELDKVQQDYIAELKSELKDTKQHLQAAIEELETTNEELQSSNEELLSSNEELQSSNEELQSLNEELHTLNTEHQLKINELIELNDDLNNYFRSTDIGQIFLDKQLRIRKFNPAVVKLINVLDLDIGRPFSNISTNIHDSDLSADIQSVMKNNTVLERELLLKNGKYSLMRIYPYVRQNKTSDGVILTFVDITSIRELNNILNSVFNASQNGIMAFRAVRDEEGQISDFVWIAVNDSTEKLFKKKSSDLIGRTLRETIPDVAKNGLQARCATVVGNNQPMYFEYFHKNGTGAQWFDAVIVKMMDGVVVTFNDVTSKKDAEDKIKANYNELIKAKEDLKKLNMSLEKKVAERTKELSASEERFRLVSKATNDAIIDWDLINNQVWLSDSFYGMFGYTAEKKDVKRSYWVNKIHPDDRQRVIKGIDHVINTNGKQWSDEYRFQTANGEYSYILDRGYVLQDEYGTPYRMLHSMMDVTSLKKAQEEVLENINQRKFLAEAMPLIVWTAGPTGKISFLNQHFSTYTGLPVQAGREWGWMDFVHGNHLKNLKTTWKNAIREGASGFELEIKIKDADGQYCWHLLRAQAMRNADGSLKMWVGTTTDINEQKMATEILEQKVEERTKELRRINDALELSNHDLQQFASVASHDLKEPLRKIHIFSNMLKDRYSETLDGGNDYVDRIISSSARMTRLINDLLAFSRLSVNSLFQKVDLNVIVNEILQDLELAIQEKSAEIKVSKLPIIDAVPGQMRQLFQNIISNALKFNKPGVTPVITIQYSAVSELSSGEVLKPGEYGRITITDNGIGFDQQYADKIFTIFQRLHTKTEFEGTGIGLAICKKIVEKHKGHINATSKIDQGTQFNILLPIKQDDSMSS